LRARPRSRKMPGSGLSCSVRFTLMRRPAGDTIIGAPEGNNGNSGDAMRKGKNSVCWRVHGERQGTSKVESAECKESRG